ncbi:hypothetical protein TSOC_013492 [Tetrabaena socialis]|uniref:Uncharacterized protein n=1 Tax=Tetrabaena socialis TaxID=47790 RepID=A0A2J7ZK84_9CHLO|nr:hypothetical protein TSOC_013492 [Tetrabaena socialis]|eukprot:PNH00672.1 hypothetical protein TSOC_013492 [Tetrabaena socialis]
MSVSSAIAELFGSERASDCDVLFCLERPEAAEEEGQQQKRARTESAPSSAAARAEPHTSAIVGEPLPGHTFVLRLASDRFLAQIERWVDGAGASGGAQGTAASSSSRAPRLQLRVPLGSEAEAPFARAAIGCAYTGVVAADGVRAALEVRRQAAYLQINGCTAACDKLLVGMLAAGSSSGAGSAADGSGGGQAAAAVDGISSRSAAVGFMACWAQLPDPAVEPTFAPVLAAAEEALVRHFGDALAALNMPSLRQQLLQLPPAGVEALLRSEAFGTDSEDSVLLLLATWMELGRPYLSVVLPALAADYETGAAGSACAWFPISIAEAGFIANLATAAAGAEKKQLLLNGAQLYDTKSPYYSTASRPQCLPRAGRNFEWAISQQELLDALVRLQPNGCVSVYGSFAAGCLLCARGLEWEVSLEVEHEATAAGVYLACDLPAAYDVTGSSMGSSKAIAVAGLEARLAVHDWRSGARRTAFTGDFEASEFGFSLGRAVRDAGRGWPTALRLAQPPQAGADGGGGGGALRGWSTYLHDGRLTAVEDEAGGSQAAAASHHARPSPAAVEFMACWAQLPDPAEEPTFAPVLAAAKEALVRHFGDALAVFNTPSLRKQLLQLPAAGVEALLGSEAFGTDSEDSVLLVLATWMKANHGQTDAATRRQLCRLVRLVQLGRPYLSVVLPALAVDHETGAAGSPCAWFPISIAEAGFITTLATAATGVEAERLLCYGCQLYVTQSSYYSTAARPQCLPWAGRTFEWAISQKELLAALNHLPPHDCVSVHSSFVGGSRQLCARGLEWRPLLEVEHEDTSAGVFLDCDLPAAYDVARSRLGSSSKFIAVAGLEARLAVHGWGGGARVGCKCGRDNLKGVCSFAPLCQCPNTPSLHQQLGVETLLGSGAFGTDGEDSVLLLLATWMKLGRPYLGVVLPVLAADHESGAAGLPCAWFPISVTEAGLPHWPSQWLGLTRSCFQQQEAQKEEKEETAEPQAGSALVGEPLPGHLLVLRLASERFRAQSSRWDNGACARAAQEGVSSSASAATRPQLRVPLGSEAEVPFARAAIGYAYTGVVAADCVRAALEVRRQAAYLQINGCTAACDELLLGMLAGSAADGSGGGQAAADARGGGRGNAGRGRGRRRQGRGWAAAATAVEGEPGGRQAAAAADNARSSLAAVEFMACWAQLPDPAEEPTFAPVLAAAKEALVWHFRDALAALSTPSLRQQLLQLPAAGVEALLGAEEFGTDSEDSVLLLLATWMKANHSQTDAATREQLCRLVRLGQLGRPYLTAVLPALAADHETGAAGSACAWFPISIAEAGFITTLATAATGVDEDRLLCYGSQLYDTKSPYYSTAVRPQCLPWAGRTFEWAISPKELQHALVRLQPNGCVSVYGSFAAGCLLCARGLTWRPLLTVDHRATSAGVFLKCSLPAAYDVAGSRLGSSSKVITIVGLEAHLVVHGWRGGARWDVFADGFEASNFNFGLGRALHSTGWGCPSALPLAQPQQAGANNGGGNMLAGWARYLHDGRLTGTLTLLPLP